MYFHKYRFEDAKPQNPYIEPKTPILAYDELLKTSFNNSKNRIFETKSRKFSITKLLDFVSYCRYLTSNGTVLLLSKKKEVYEGNKGMVIKRTGFYL